MSIGDRFKQYEDVERRYLTPKTYKIIRLDGVHFHTYCKTLNKPFDDKFIADMDEVAKFLCAKIQGAKFAFVQSDEISILLTDFDTFNTETWFNGNIQKIVSVSASMAAAKFNELRPGKLAYFDSRIFILPNLTETINYFIWRQQDSTKNSIFTVARSLYSHQELENKYSQQLQEMIFQKGINWDQYPVKYKRGRAIIKQLYLLENSIPRFKWETVDPPIFSQEKDFICNFIDNASKK